MRKAYEFVKQAAIDFGDDDCMSSGAAIAYYTIFSLPPLLGIAFIAATWFGVGHERIDEAVRSQLGMPTATAEQEASGGETAGGGPQAEQLANKTLEGSGGLITKIVGIAVLIFSATGVFAQLQYTLNRVWEVKPDPAQGGLRAFVFKRVLSLGMIVVIVFLLLVSLVLTTVLEYLVGLLTGGEETQFALAMGIVLNNLVAFIAATLLFAALYKILPDAKMHLRDVWIGAAATALLFVVGKAILGWYLKMADVGSGWGNAAANLIAILVWVYYSALIVLFGAELTQVWANQFGHGIEPAEGAIRVETQDVRRPSGGRHARPAMYR